MRFTVEPSPAGGYHVRMAGSAKPLSHHDTQEEAEARLAAYEQGAADPRELVDLPDGSEVLLRSTEETIVAYDARGATELGTAWFAPDPRRPGVASASVTVVEAWRGRGLGGLLLRRLSARAAAAGIHAFIVSVRTEDPAMRRLFERIGRVEPRGEAIEVEVPVADAPTLLRSASTGHLST
jgi:GNAT superfamily N-acetyltransferase